MPVEDKKTANAAGGNEEPTKSSESNVPLESTAKTYTHVDYQKAVQDGIDKAISARLDRERKVTIKKFRDENNLSDEYLEKARNSLSDLEKTRLEVSKREQTLVEREAEIASLKASRKADRIDAKLTSSVADSSVPDLMVAWLRTQVDYSDDIGVHVLEEGKPSQKKVEDLVNEYYTKNPASRKPMGEEGGGSRIREPAKKSTNGAKAEPLGANASSSDYASRLRAAIEGAG